MNYYEELGVPQDAPLDTIREAYRNVVRLLHPDAQTNPVLKESAEVQMRRINHLYETLADAERRRRYDVELKEPSERPSPIIIQTPPADSHIGTWAWLIAAAVCAVFVAWLATRGSSPPVEYPQALAAPGAGASAPVVAARSVVVPDPQRNNEIVRLRAELAAANADRDRLMKRIAFMEAERSLTPLPPPSPAMPAPVPLTPQVVPVDIPVPARTVLTQSPKSNWSGVWAFQHPQLEERNLEDRSKRLFPPEFIEASISEENGRIRGNYHARFRVADTRISPDVDFRFEGRVSGMSGRFSWTGTGGARGEVQLRLTAEASLEVVWTATDLGQSMGLASGTAVLSRRN